MTWSRICLAFLTLRNAVLRCFGISAPVEAPFSGTSGYRDLFRRGFRTVIDVGAHVGEFSSLVHKELPSAKILAFEPLPGAFRILSRKMDDFGNGSVSYNFALGETDGELTMNEYAFTPASSLLPICHGAWKLYPYLGWNKRRRVFLKRLDSIIGNLELPHPVLLKIDVQGYEDRVLRGARRTLDQVDVILVETSYLPLYEGQPLIADIKKQLEETGFKYTGQALQHMSFFGGKVVQEDSIFERV